MQDNKKIHEFSYASATLHLFIFALFTVVYLFAFNKIEARSGAVHIINIPLDNFIPFFEFFVIPYVLWFIYVLYFILVFLKKDLTEYYRMGSFLAAGMTLFIIISIFFPNGLILRPNLNAIGRENIFIDMVRIIYKKDTSTNVFPSIHVYNTIGVMLSCIYANDKLNLKKWQKYIAYGLGVAIILSTVFLKQHSIIDVLGACIMGYIFYTIFYNEKYTNFLCRIGFYGIPNRQALFFKASNEDSM